MTYNVFEVTISISLIGSTTNLCRGGVKLDIAAFVVATLTLMLALFIHSETRDALGRMNAIVDTLPGAHDVKRLILDMEKTKSRRGKVICRQPKNTYIAWEPLSAESLSPKERFWRGIRKLANSLSGQVYDCVIEEVQLHKKWMITYRITGGSDLDELLTDGWEPFAVSGEDKIWLRRSEVIREEKTTN